MMFIQDSAHVKITRILLLFLLFFFSSSSYMALQSDAALRLLNGHLPVRSVFRPFFPFFNLATVNIFLHTGPACF
jgi:hypothetical protein